MARNLLLILTGKRPREPDTDADCRDELRADDTDPYESFFGLSESDAQNGRESLRDGTLSKRFQTKLGLSGRQWTWFVSIMLFVPYPILVSLGVIYDIDDTLFLPATLILSIILIVFSFYL